MADTPHFAVPFRLDPGSVRVVDQDSDEDLLGCVWAVCSTEIGSRDELPEYGVEDLAFRRGEDIAVEIVDAVREWEPRVTVETTTEIEGLIMKAEAQIG